MNDDLPFKNVNLYKYYCVERPLSYNLYPRIPSGKINFIENYTKKIFIDAINREAYGEITCSCALKKSQLIECGLVKDPNYGKYKKSNDSKEKIKIHKQLIKGGIVPSSSLIDDIYELNHICNCELSLLEIRCRVNYKNQAISNLATKIRNECEKQRKTIGLEREI